jgi:hypothetical protein
MVRSSLTCWVLLRSGLTDAPLDDSGNSSSQEAGAGVRRMSANYFGIAFFNVINIYFSGNSGQLGPRLDDRSGYKKL